MHRDTGRTDYLLTWDDYLAGWRFVGKAQSETTPARSPEREAILSALRAAEAATGMGLPPVAVAERVGKSRESVRYLLHKMQRNGEVVVDSEGRYTPALDNQHSTPNTPNTPNRPPGAPAPQPSPIWLEGFAAQEPLLGAADTTPNSPNRLQGPLPESVEEGVRAVRGVSAHTPEVCPHCRVLSDWRPDAAGELVCFLCKHALSAMVAPSRNGGAH